MEGLGRLSTAGKKVVSPNDKARVKGENQWRECFGEAGARRK